MNNNIHRWKEKVPKLRMSLGETEMTITLSKQPSTFYSDAIECNHYTSVHYAHLTFKKRAVSQMVPYLVGVVNISSSIQEQSNNISVAFVTGKIQSSHSILHKTNHGGNINQCAHIITNTSVIEDTH